MTDELNNEVSKVTRKPKSGDPGSFKVVVDDLDMDNSVHLFQTVFTDQENKEHSSQKPHSLASAENSNLKEVRVSRGNWEKEEGGTTVTLAYKDGSKRQLNNPVIQAIGSDRQLAARKQLGGRGSAALGGDLQFL